MSAPIPLSKENLTSAMSSLVDQYAFDPNYANGLQIFAHKQEVFEPIWAAYTKMLENGKLDRGLKELVRIKIAQNNDCSPYIDKSGLRSIPSAPHVLAGIDEEKLAEVSRYEVSEKLSRAEKLAIKFAEKLGIEHESLDDEFFSLLREEFTDAEIVELAHVVAVGIGFERFIAVWQPQVCAL